MVRTALPCIFLVLAGCTVGPDYRPPSFDVLPAWSEAPAAADTPADEGFAWWARFGDAQLTALVDRALEQNLDLRIAAARVREAQALRRVVAADLWPTVDAKVDGSVATGSMNSLFLGALDALWEIDVFGGVRRSVEAADADVEAALAARRAVRLAVASETARSYVELRGFQHRIATLRQNLAAQRETRELTEAQQAAGLASDLDVERARALVAGTAAELPPLQAARKAAVHRLGVLLGQPPSALADELAAAAPIPAAPREVVLGVPADLLRRRPDLGRAERELAAATARIGEAQADLYPRFTLTGSVGLRSEDVKDLVQGKGGFAAIGPNIVWPVFAAGRIRANVAVQNARQEQALARYELTLLEAFEDVETSLARYAHEQVRRRALAEAVAANREATRLARRLYANGLAGFLDVLVAELALRDSESRLVESETAVSTSLVEVYVALGGGWQEADTVALQ